mgnify:CR=1 FL=1
MEMIDVLQKLKEIAETKPELVKDALENVEKTNPKTVTEGGMKDFLHDEAEKMSREEFIKKHGESLAGFWDSINGTEEAVEGKMPAGLKAYQDKKAGKEEKKEEVKESIQISADTPQEASMMMQLLKLAGVQPVDQAMISQGEPEAEPEANHDDEMGSQEMGRMRDMMTAPEEEKAEETFANSIIDVIPENGFIFVSVSNRFPYVADPVDTLFRPDLKELKELFPNTKIIKESIIEGPTYFQFLIDHKTVLAITLVRLLTPFYKFKNWKNLVKYVPNLFKPFRTSCLILQKCR